MQEIINLMNTYEDYIILAVIVSYFLAMLLFILIIYRLNKTKKRYETLLRGIKNKNLEDIILNTADKVNYLEGFIKTLHEKIEEVAANLGDSLKNVYLERYNAFPGIGGEQSFSLALLDDEGTGVVITCIHTRDESRTYAKFLRKGHCKQILSEEEKGVIEKALNKNLSQNGK